MVAILGAAIVLVVAAWYDTDPDGSGHADQGSTFDVTQTKFALPVGYLIVATGVLIVALVTRRADSRLVDVVYVAVGGFLTLLFTLVWTLAATINGAPPVLPDPLASLMDQAYTTAETGTLNAVAIIGAAMLVVGLADLGIALPAQDHPQKRESRRAQSAPGSMPAPQDT